MFASHWHDTPVHFVGQEYNAKGVDAWVNPRFVPSGGKISGFSSERTKLNGELDVVCWAKNDVKAFELADDIINFVTEFAKEFPLTNFEINDHGWNDSNMVYIVVTFVFTYYAGNCPLLGEIVKDNGAIVMNNGAIVVN
jgi:hypothetical protein